MNLNLLRLLGRLIFRQQESDPAFFSKVTISNPDLLSIFQAIYSEEQLNSVSQIDLLTKETCLINVSNARKISFYLNKIQTIVEMLKTIQQCERNGIIHENPNLANGFDRSIQTLTELETVISQDYMVTD